MKNKWATMLMTLGFILICTSPLFNKQAINILMGVFVVITGFIISKKG